jgi:hypothetical protein
MTFEVNRSDDIFYVCEHRMIGEIERLSAFVNTEDASGQTPLCVAVAQGSVETVKMLFKHGAVAHASDFALFLCAQTRPFSEKIACLLLDHGCDANATSYYCKNGLTRSQPLNIYTFGELTVEAMRFFASRGVRPSAADVIYASQMSWCTMLDFYGHAGYLEQAYSSEHKDIPPTSASLAFFMMFDALPVDTVRHWLLHRVHMMNAAQMILCEIMRVDKKICDDVGLCKKWISLQRDSTEKDFALRVNYARRDVARERWNRVVAPKAAQICVALQPLGLAAEELVAVIAAAFPSDSYSYRKWWDVAVAVKHFKV